MTAWDRRLAQEERGGKCQEGRGDKYCYIWLGSQEPRSQDPGWSTVANNYYQLKHHSIFISLLTHYEYLYLYYNDNPGLLRTSVRSIITITEMITQDYRVSMIVIISDLITNDVIIAIICCCDLVAITVLLLFFILLLCYD